MEVPHQTLPDEQIIFFPFLYIYFFFLKAFTVPHLLSNNQWIIIEPDFLSVGAVEVLPLRLENNLLFRLLSEVISFVFRSLG